MQFPNGEEAKSVEGHPEFWQNDPGKVTLLLASTASVNPSSVCLGLLKRSVNSKREISHKGP